jgi:hypothetical protein
MTWITTAIRKAGLEPASSERLGPSRESRGGGWSPRPPEQQWLTQTAFCRDSQQQIQERQTLAH